MGDVETEYGRAIHPKGAKDITIGIYLLYIILIFFNLFMAINNIGRGDWFWAIIELFFAILFLLFIIFLSFGKLILFERGFLLNPSVFNRVFRGQPKFVNFQDILSIRRGLS